MCFFYPFIGIIETGETMRREQLLKRMDEIGRSAAKIKDVLAVLALGSIGVEQNRLDDYSDLDFFIVTEDHIKATMINDLRWLNDCYPVAFSFQNTPDGHKFFFEDGIYGEFAVFGRSEIPHVVQNQARLVYKKEGYDEPTLLVAKSLPVQHAMDPQAEIHEAMTNLYVGLMRAMRGEILSGERFIEHYAVDHILKAYFLIHPVDRTGSDPFNLERRIESYDLTIKNALSRMIQGYSRLSLSAEAILLVAQSMMTINPWLLSHLQACISQLKKIEKINL
jgi:hypothetical protein